jgi:hypothetical protein
MSYTTLRRVSPFFVCALIGVLSSAHAQYVGPSSTKSLSTVAETLKNPQLMIKRSYSVGSS